MRFPGRAELALDAQVKLQTTALKPGAASSSEIRRLRNFHQPEQFAVELARQRFAAGRHGELNVVDAIDRHSIIQAARR